MDGQQSTSQLAPPGQDELEAGCDDLHVIAHLAFPISISILSSPAQVDVSSILHVAVAVASFIKYCVGEDIKAREFASS